MRTCAAAGAVVLALAAAATAQAAPRQTFDASFTSGEPGAATGYTLAIDYVNPDDPQAKPYAVARVVVEPPAGTRIDTAVPARCTATEPELMLLGAAACPPGSVVGGGELDLDTGALGSADRVTLLNNEDELIFLTQPKDAPVVSVVTRAEIRDDGAIVTTVPPLPGVPPPDTFTALDRVALTVDDGRRGYVTTPASCPASGSWTWRASFTYRDGVTETVESPSPCAPAPAAATATAPACLPRRLRIGARGIGELRLGRWTGGAPRCVTGGGEVIVATRDGRARLIATTAPGHAIRGVHPGSTARRLARGFPRARRIGAGLRRDGTIVFGIRRGSVRFIVVTGRREARSPARLRRALSRAGLQR